MWLEGSNNYILLWAQDTYTYKIDLAVLQYLIYYLKQKSYLIY